MLVFGLTSAAYNPAANTWRPIAREYGAMIAAVRVWTGHQAIFWGGGCCGGANADGAAYTPATNTWQKLPRSPLAARYATGTWTGTEMVIAGGHRPVTVNGVDQMHTYADAAAYNPATRTWRRLAPMPQPRAPETAIWDGTEALFLGGSQGTAHSPAAAGVAYNPANGQWRRLAAMETSRTGFAAVWTGRQVLVWGGYTGPYTTPVIPPHGLAYGPAANRWSPLPMSPLHGRTGPTAVWTGRQMIVWGGVAPSAEKTTILTDGAAYQPGGS
jgi:N-acetylneuraminic acid mutarotase